MTSLLISLILYLFLTAGSHLHRGYCYEAVMDDKPVDITHLVFVITAGSHLHRGYCYEAVMDDKPVDITHLVFVSYSWFSSSPWLLL